MLVCMCITCLFCSSMLRSGTFCRVSACFWSRNFWFSGSEFVIRTCSITDGHFSFEKANVGRRPFNTILFFNFPIFVHAQVLIDFFYSVCSSFFFCGWIRGKRNSMEPIFFGEKTNDSHAIATKKNAARVNKKINTRSVASAPWPLPKVYASVDKNRRKCAIYRRCSEFRYWKCSLSRSVFLFMGAVVISTLFAFI